MATRDAGAEELLREIDAVRDDVRGEARAVIGVSGSGEVESMRSALRRTGVGWYPLAALSSLAIVDTFQGYAFGVLTPEIGKAMGLGLGAISGALALKSLAIAVAPLPMAAIAQRPGIRAWLCVGTGFGWSLMTLYTGYVTSLIGLLVVLFVDGLTTGSVTTLHTPLVMDSYPPSVRVRALSLYGSATHVGSLVSPLLVGALASWFGLNWRGVFLCLGVISTAICLLSIRLRDPGFGRWDTMQIREAVHRRNSADDSEHVPLEQVELGFWEICRRLLASKTNKRLLTGVAVFGMLTVPLGTFMAFFLQSRWGLSPGERSLFIAYQALISAISLMLNGRIGERAFAKNPSRLMQLVGAVCAGAILFIVAGGVAPYLWLMILCFGCSAALLGVLGPALGAGMMSIIPSVERPHLQALSGLATALGGVAGALLLADVNTQYGNGATLLAVALPGLVGGWIISTSGRYVQEDLDRMIDAVVEEEEIKAIVASGRRLPMLACRGIDFSYGSLQVLFGVDFTVEEGEMVALLGVNGAGKSTLLKAISGIGIPTRGSIRLSGQDITYLAAPRRVPLGISQVPGGRAVFGTMTVLENLRTYGYTFGKDKAWVASAIESSLESFPRLAERRDSLAATLSGGEQQMLGLSKALILRPRILLIDELSLGLAPVVVEQLLELVRRINAQGTSVVLVEQSVNIALNLVEHAYFMEKGEMRFDGPSSDLVGRSDLLRAVFLPDTAGSGSVVGKR